MFLTLIGYRCTGKTTLARLVAERLGCDWADSDVELQRRAGRSIAEIFAEQGEVAFRRMEEKIIAELCRRQRLILAVGGGAPMSEANRRAIRAAGRVVWLAARPETILARMEADPRSTAHRPPLSDKPPLDEIVELLAARTPCYRQLADLTLDTDQRRPDELAAEIAGRPGRNWSWLLGL
jgi:shikimate kinase